MDWYAIAALVVAAAGTGAWINGIFERRHASTEAEKERTERRDQAEKERAERRDEARAERIFRVRSDAYAEAAAYLRRERLYVERTLPVIGPLPDPPEPLDDAEWARVLGRISVHASDDALDALDVVRQRTNAFAGRVMTHHMLEQQAERRGNLAAQVFEARVAADEPRNEAFEAMDHAERSCATNSPNSDRIIVGWAGPSPSTARG